jgi:hypothetical protein
VSLTLRRAATAGNLIWWTNAVLAGTTSSDDALPHISGEVLLPTSVTASSTGHKSTAEARHRLSWPLAWGWFRRHESNQLRLVIPVPGDPVGITADKDVVAAAIAAGVVLVADDVGQALVPITADLWQAKPISDGLPAGGLGTFSEARREMREAMVQVAETFAGIEPDQGTRTALADLRRNRLTPQPPPGVAPRAAQLAQSAGLVWETTRLALSVTKTAHINAELRALNHAARRAVSVAFSHPVTSI